MHLVVSVCLIPLFCAHEPLPNSKPFAPDASLRCLRADPSFRVELVAAEPLIADPIAIAWGADGKLWVVEMGGYPLGADGHGQPGGCIRYLEDTNDDGTYDRSTVFLDELGFPTGVIPWHKGILVTCAPNIFYAEDSDGDGKADRREVLFTGFGEGNPQHRVNGLRLGLDNWIYCANGDNGGTIKSLKSGQAVNIFRRDFRIRPDVGLLDPQSGMSQFSRCRDDWGNWFGGNSAVPLWHCALADHYIHRNPFVVAPDPCVELIYPPFSLPVYPISPTSPRFNEPAATNRLTSACGVSFYRDELFGPIFNNSYFICEPAHNLVHCEQVTRRGVSFTSKPLVDQRTSEFLASTDNWFRPTQVRTGPDGALWVVDMYRKVIEHPDFIPRNRNGKLDFRAGQSMGRIYRVYPAHKNPRRVPRLSILDTRHLVAALDNVNGPMRDMVQQLLVERHDEQAVPLLEAMVVGNKRAACRLQALCTLDGLNAVTNLTLRHALADLHYAVRKHAVRICESRIDMTPELQELFLQTVDDPDPQVRLQLACSLGAWSDPRAGRALSQLAKKDAQDPLVIAAIMSSATEYAGAVLEGVLEQPNRSPAHTTLIKDLVLFTVDSGDEAACACGFQEIAEASDGLHEAWQFNALAGVLDGLDRRHRSLVKLHEVSGDTLRSAFDALESIFAEARHRCVDQDAPLEIQLSAVRIIARGLQNREQDVALLGSLLAPQVPTPVQEAAVASLGQLHRPNVPNILLNGWQQHSPGLRTHILDTLVSRRAWRIRLLERIEAKQISAATIGLRHRGPLLLDDLPEVRRRAAAVFEDPIDENRERVIRRNRGALTLTGEVARGEVIFKRLCHTCHQQSETGPNIGPDLWTLTDRSPENLLVDILHPNRAIDPRYCGYTAITLDGRIVTGTLVNEIGDAITLIDSQRKSHVLLRSELSELVGTGKSLMPEGLESEIPGPQGMADLIAYLSFDQPVP